MEIRGDDTHDGSNNGEVAKNFVKRNPMDAKSEVRGTSYSIRQASTHIMGPHNGATTGSRMYDNKSCG